MRFLVLPAALVVLALASGCDSGADGLRLDGTYRGSGTSPVATGADPTPIQVDVTATFADVAPGSFSADLRVEATAFSEPDVYTGRVSGTLSESGAVSFSGTLSDGVNPSISFSASGDASERQIEVDVTGSLPVGGLVLRR